MQLTSCAFSGILLAICLASAQDLPPIVISGQSSGPAATYTGAGAGTQDATCDPHGPRKQCGAQMASVVLFSDEGQQRWLTSGSQVEFKALAEQSVCAPALEPLRGRGSPNRVLHLST